MKPIRNQATDDLQNEIKKRFTEFNKSSSPSKGRKYPKPLKDLVSRAAAQGIGQQTLRRLTSMSGSTVSCCCKKLPAKLPRRLEIIETETITPQVVQPTGNVLVRLPSGISIE